MAGYFNSVWNPATLISPMALGSGNAVASVPAGQTLAVGAVKSAIATNISVLTYFEFSVRDVGNEFWSVGVAGNNYVLLSNPGGWPLGFDSGRNSLGTGYFSETSGLYFGGSLIQATTSISLGPGEVIVIAMTTSQAWISVDGGVTWGGGGNPCAGTGGASLAGLGPGPYYAVFQATSVGNSPVTVALLSPGGGDPCGVPGPNFVTVADLWFGQTSGFVDLSVDSNRRNFVSSSGAAQYLGSSGQNPFGSAPPVFLTSSGNPSSFANNNGRGGQFVALGGALTAGGSNPPSSSQTTTSFTPSATGQGMLGSYLDGKLYVFNPTTLTDDGSPRKWVRRWRALPQATMTAVKFDALAIKMESGIGVPPGTNPQLMLRWSDDGGFSWSNERIISVGRTGETAFTVKANRLGMTRRFGGSDRIFELSSTDPFVIAILDAEVEAQ